MSIRAIARHEPPTRKRRSGLSGNSFCNPAIVSLICALTAFLPPLIPCSFNGPRSELRQVPISPLPFSSANSIEEPPISQIMPSAPGQPSSTPCADRRASSSPSTTWMVSPVSASASARNSGPSSASRTAAVATAIRAETFMPEASAANLFSAAIARGRPSADKRPVSAKPAPRPQSTFSL